jgi:hypothetical protein
MARSQGDSRLDTTILSGLQKVCPLSSTMNLNNYSLSLFFFFFFFFDKTV